MPAEPTTTRPGRAIERCTWGANVLFALTAIPAAIGLDALDGVAIGVALGLFLVSLPVWLWALGLAALRSARGDDVAVSSLFLWQGLVPAWVRKSLLGALAVSVVIAAVTAAAEPFGVLVPMLPLGFCGLWGARHGTYPPRKDR